MRASQAIIASCVFATSYALPTCPNTESEWDVIVVGRLGQDNSAVIEVKLTTLTGAGPAGIVVADRMSEAGKKTLLLEQGGPSYYITGGRERPDWLQNTNLSRVDVPGLYKSIYVSLKENEGTATCH